MADSTVGGGPGSLFGWLFQRKPEPVEPPSFAPKEHDDGAVIVAPGGSFGTMIDLDGTIRSEAELVTKYREMVVTPEVDNAVDEIVNEVIPGDEDTGVQVVLDDVNQSVAVKKAIEEAFDDVLDILNYRHTAYNLFRRWYIDGRLYFHIIIDEENTKDGIQEIRYIDPRKIRKIREVVKKQVRGPMMNSGDAVVIQSKNEYYLFSDKGFNVGNKWTGPATSGVKIAKDAIVHCTSGQTDAIGSVVLSFLHKAIKPLNQLRVLEDSAVIYRLCVEGNSRIKTPSGWKYIKEMKIGEEVFSFNPESGKQIQTKITGWWNKGTQKTLKLSSKHFNIEATPTHPILVKNKKTGCVGYVDAQDIIIKQHQIVIPSPNDYWEEISFPNIRNNVASISNKQIWGLDQRFNKEKTIKDTSSRCQSKGVHKFVIFFMGFKPSSRRKKLRLL